MQQCELYIHTDSTANGRDSGSKGFAQRDWILFSGYTLLLHQRNCWNIIPHASSARLSVGLHHSQNFSRSKRERGFVGWMTRDVLEALLQLVLQLRVVPARKSDQHTE
jgi:hypothetical protein